MKTLTNSIINSIVDGKMDFEYIVPALKKEPGRRIKALNLIESRLNLLRSIQNPTEHNKNDIQKLEEVKSKIKALHNPVIVRKAPMVKHYGSGPVVDYFDLAPPVKEPELPDVYEVTKPSEPVHKTDNMAMNNNPINDVLSVMIPGKCTTDDLKNYVKLSFKGSGKIEDLSNTLLYEMSVWFHLNNNELAKYDNPGLLAKKIASDTGRKVSSIRGLLAHYPFNMPERLKPKTYKYTRDKKDISEKISAPISGVSIPIKVSDTQKKESQILDNADRELQVMGKISELIKLLAGDERKRVIQWIIARFMPLTA